MIKATVLSGNEFSYTAKSSGEIKTGYTIWYTLEGFPYSFKAGFFTADQIAKAKAAVENKTCYFDLKPDRNCQPVFVMR